MPTGGSLLCRFQPVTNIRHYVIQDVLEVVTRGVTCELLKPTQVRDFSFHVFKALSMSDHDTVRAGLLSSSMSSG